MSSKPDLIEVSKHGWITNTLLYNVFFCNANYTCADVLFDQTGSSSHLRHFIALHSITRHYSAAIWPCGRIGRVAGRALKRRRVSRTLRRAAVILYRQALDPVEPASGSAGEVSGRSRRRPDRASGRRAACRGSTAAAPLPADGDRDRAAGAGDE